jgi:hypothetical protein
VNVARRAASARARVAVGRACCSRCGTRLAAVELALVGIQDFMAGADPAARRGEFSDVRVAYLATDGELGVTTEIFSGTPSADVTPDATSP